ncbi:MAG: ABC transporter ATP-binding protein, partial [Eubacteriales bacterium]|nr:ABC transporter ATP-binding protein [Eubacteriales bacterium]
MRNEKASGQPAAGKRKSIFAYYGPYKKLFMGDMLCAFFEAVATLIIPLIIRYITGTVVGWDTAEALPVIYRLGAVMIALCIVQLLCQWYTIYIGHMVGTFQERDMRSELYAHLQKLSFTYYDNAKVGALLSRVTSDLFEITELLHHGPEDICISIIKIFGAFAILCFINAKLAMVSLLMLALMLSVALYFNIRMKKSFTERRAALADMNGQLEDSLSGIRVVKSFANEAREIEHFEKQNDKYVEAKRHSYVYMANFQSSMNFFSSLITVISIIIGAMLMAGGSLSVADLVAFILYINNFVEPVKKLVNFTEVFQSGWSGFKRFREVMDVMPDIEDAPDAKPLSVCRGDVEFDHVSFHYADHKELVLRDVNLRVAAGDYVALCGSSGAGKTTLCSLIPRFYDVTEGAVRIDGQDVRSLQLNSLRSQIGIVQQDVYLFAGTVL